MKSTFFNLIAIALIFADCSNHQNSEQKTAPGMHRHEDGSTHEDHEHHDKPNQIEFTVGQDSIGMKGDSTKNKMHEEHEHPHQHDQHK